MQTLQMHKKSTSNNASKLATSIQKTEQIGEEIERRENERITALITSRRMYRLENTNVFYIESSKPSIVYYCRYTFASSGNFCSCKSFEFKGNLRDCKHLDMIPIGILKGKIIDVPALPKDVIKDNMVSKSYLEDEYTF